jgi:hypothetical protein
MESGVGGWDKPPRGRGAPQVKRLMNTHLAGTLSLLATRACSTLVTGTSHSWRTRSGSPQSWGAVESNRKRPGRGGLSLLLDELLCRRAPGTAQGQKPIYIANALVRHPARSSFRAICKKGSLVAVGQKQLDRLGLLDHGRLSLKQIVPVPTWPMDPRWASSLTPLEKVQLLIPAQLCPVAQPVGPGHVADFIGRGVSMARIHRTRNPETPSKHVQVGSSQLDLMHRIETR